MWADTLLDAERAHLLRLLLWAGLSVLVGTALLVLVLARRRGTPLLRHFAIQMLAWGIIEGAMAFLSWRGLALRDHSAAVRLDRILWLNAGLDVGYLAVGATLGIAGWALGRRLAAVGAGIGVALQGAALLALDLVFLSITTRFV